MIYVDYFTRPLSVLMKLYANQNDDDDATTNVHGACTELSKAWLKSKANLKSGRGS